MKTSEKTIPIKQELCRLPSVLAEYQVGIVGFPAFFTVAARPVAGIAPAMTHALR